MDAFTHTYLKLREPLALNACTARIPRTLPNILFSNVSDGRSKDSQLDNNLVKEAPHLKTQRPCCADLSFNRNRTLQSCRHWMEASLKAKNTISTIRYDVQWLETRLVRCRLLISNIAQDPSLTEQKQLINESRSTDSKNWTVKRPQSLTQGIKVGGFRESINEN